VKIVLQRISTASVYVEGEIIGTTGRGLLLLVGADSGDDEGKADYLADKILGLRIFEDNDGKMNRSVIDIGGEIMAVSQFTLSADIAKGRRPSFSTAMKPDEAEKLFDYFVNSIKNSGLKVKTGKFGAKMEINLVNEGPVTFVLSK
jgi:D-tyrosyl-tRNA(Tyr) deacylase